MFVGSSYLQIGGDVLRFHYQIFTAMCRVEHTVFLFFNDISEIPIANQIIKSQKTINNFVLYYFNDTQSMFKPLSRYFL